MPTKHIPDKTWKKVQNETVKAVIETKEAIRDTDVLNWLILKGIKVARTEGYKELID